MTGYDSQLTLTAIEATALHAPCNLADGHAKLPPVIDALRPQLLQELATTPLRELENRFLKAFYPASWGQPAAEDVILCPSASLAIDTVAKYLHRSGRTRVGLIEPTFDNLFLLLRAQGLTVMPVPEDDAAIIRAAKTYDALILVLPNNPTGWVPSVATLQSVGECATKHDCLIVLDQTFRFYDPSRLSSHITSSGCNWVTIDDTGRTWSTLECKVAFLQSRSAETLSHLETIAQEITLNVSPLSLYLTTETIRAEKREQRALEAIRANVNIMRQVLSPIGYKDLWRNLPVTLVQFPTCIGRDGCEASGILAQFGVAVLPGSQFYWSNPSLGDKYVRIALMRPGEDFRQAIERICLITEQHGKL